MRAGIRIVCMVLALFMICRWEPPTLMKLKKDISVASAYALMGAGKKRPYGDRFCAFTLLQSRKNQYWRATRRC